PLRPPSAIAIAFFSLEVSIPTKASLLCSMTHLPCVRLYPAYPGNPRIHIEGESPLNRKGHTVWVSQRDGYRSRTSEEAFRLLNPSYCSCNPAHAAVQPPSIERFAPVICAAASEHKYTASAATWSTVTNSLVGCAARSTSRLTCSSVMCRAFMVSGI